MEKTKLETLNPLVCDEATLNFPQHHRSHLKSKTFEALVRILSICVDESQNSHSVSDNPNPGTRGYELEQMTEQENHNRNLLVENDNETNELELKEGSKDLVCLDRLVSSELLVDKDPSVDGVIASINNQHNDFCLDQSVLDESERGVQEIDSSVLLVEKDSNVDRVIASSINSQDDYLCSDRIVSDKSVGGAQETTDNECVSFDISEAIRSVDDTQITPLLEMNVVEELEPERQHKEDTVKDSFAGLIEDGEIEEGEIPDDVGVCNQLDDSILEDSVVPEAGTVEEGHIPGDLIKQGKFDDTCTEQKGTKGKDITFTSHLQGKNDSTNNRVREELEEKTCKGKEDKSYTLDYGKTWKVEHVYGGYSMREAEIGKNEVDEAKADTNCPIDYPDGLGYPREIWQRVVSENQGNTYKEKDVKVGDKRKRTKARGGNKKLKKSKKRAEKNKQLGVKRLKLQPISKPKTVKYCNYFIHGKCQQGDSCKFSHDTTPLTKSQPCKFFALHSCLKGDDCPFDHQLSKYPCNNYKSKGFCSRGDSCLFSHKMLPMEGSSPASDVSQTELKSPTMLGGTNSERQKNKITSCQTPNMSKETPPSMGTFIHRYPRQNSAEMRLKLPVQAPKGINFLLFGKSSCDDSRKQQQSDLPSQTDNGSQVYQQKNQSVLEKFQDSNEIPTSRLPLCRPSNMSVGEQNNTPDSAQKALLSTLAFASKYESKMMMGRSTQSSAPNVETDKGSKSASNSSSGSIQNGSMPASKILQEFLFGGGGTS